MKALLHLCLLVACIVTSAPAAKPETAAASKQIDALLAQSWKKHQLTPNAPVDDGTFLCRTYLTVVGRIPTLDEAEAFHASKVADKCAKLIDFLLASEGYVQHYFNFWADVYKGTDALFY